VHGFAKTELTCGIFVFSWRCVGAAVQKPAEIAVPVLWLTEEINAEFEGLSLICVGLQGSLQLRTPPPRSRSDKEIEFSFSLNQASSIKVFLLPMQRHFKELSCTQGHLSIIGYY